MRVAFETIRWQNMAIRIRHVSGWSGTEMDHVEIQTIEPESAPLPITDTGYRSHFMHGEDLAAHGGPIAFVLAWLEYEAKTEKWRKHVEASKQLSLF